MTDRNSGHAPLPPRLLRPEEAAEFLQISVRSLHRLVKNGEIRTVPIGNRIVRFRLEDLLEFIERK